MKYLIILLALCGVSRPALSQVGTLSGSVRDTANKRNLQHAVVYLKDPANSKLQSYTRSGADGSFTLQPASAGIYVLVVTYPGYVDWIDSVTVGRATPPLAIHLTPQAKLLEEVVVKAARAPILFKGDTTEYIADSFHLPPDATVEDMLRILPGMSVNAKGQITVHGQRVQQVLVDGDEFFGNDPTLATQNLRKDDIARVQVYDKKTDRSLLTGIDDGIKEKTVNLIMKDDAKKGYFGELSGGTDFDRYYQSKATISRFTKSMKAGAFFSMDRTGRGNASFEEDADFGTSSGARQGIPETIQAAGMFNQKFGRMNNSTANNIGYNRLNIVGNSYTGIQYILPDTVYYNNQSAFNKTSLWQTALNSKNELKLDSSSTLTVYLKGREGETDNTSLRNGKYLASDNTTLVNTNEQQNRLSGEEQTGSAEMYYKKSFDKKGTRFLTLNATLNGNNSSSESFLYNKTTFFTNGQESGQELVDQKKDYSNRSYAMQGLASYVTPLSKVFSLNINYTFNWENTTQDMRSYESSNGKYDSLNRLFSNKYNYVNASHRGGSVLTYTFKKITAKTGLAVQNIRMKQFNYYNDSTAIRNFVNVFPTANLAWKLSTATSMTFNYSGRTQQPSFAQLQPILNNSDPLNIQVGNPRLRPAFYHALDGQFNLYKAVTGRVIRMYGYLSLAQNDFSNRSELDLQGRRSYQTINIHRNYTYNSWITYAWDIKRIHTRISLQPGIWGARYSNYINGLRNTTRIFSVSPTVYINSTIEKVLDIQSNYSIDFRRSTSSINPQLSNQYRVHTFWLHLLGYTIKGWKINSSFNYNIRSRISANDANTNAAIWNLVVEKKILPKSGISMIARFNDILNQNIGFSRSINSNGITENTFETVQRYVLLSLSWKFNKNRGNQL